MQIISICWKDIEFAVGWLRLTPLRLPEMFATGWFAYWTPSKVENTSLWGPCMLVICPLNPIFDVVSFPAGGVCSEFDASLEPKLLTTACLYAFRAYLLTIVLDPFMLSIACGVWFAKTRFIFDMHGTQLKTASNEGTSHSSILNMVMPSSMCRHWAANC